MVLTFAGPSSLFTAIVMTKSLTREEFLRTTVYTAIFRDKRRQLTPSERNGCRIVDSERFLVRVPQAMTRIGDLASKRMTIIDDTVTTGSVMEHLRDYFVQRGFLRENIQCVTCVCSHQAWSDPRTRPDVWIFRPKGSYRMPWGDPL